MPHYHPIDQRATLDVSDSIKGERLKSRRQCRGRGRLSPPVNTTFDTGRLCISWRSENEGEHCLSSSWVLLAELFLVVVVLLCRPDGHLSDRNRCKEGRGGG